MKQQALGLIETHGLVAAIEAADAALKTAAVELINYQKVTGGLLTIALTGEVAAVQAAVAAGSAAAAKVGILVSQHVIPRPMADIELLIKTRKKSPGPADPSPAGPGGPGQAPVSPGNDGETGTKVPSGTDGEKVKDLQEQLAGLGVEELRRLARKTPGIAIKGRQISRANKEVLIKEILRAKSSQ
ncbi:MAG: BMC domain protein [Firmicutes bacterium HGW-Firmicutes-14]|nr:MAG: BMC domain protein [Firmicutes bacterium HGW-Firmicutes-14]